MPRAKAKPRFSWLEKLTEHSIPMLIGIIGIAVVFYFNTNATLTEHAHQFAEIGKKFDQFNTTMVKNYDDYAKNQSAEKDARDKLREQFMALIKEQNTSFAAMSSKLSNIDAQTAVQGERYNNLKNALDQIQASQQRSIQQRR